jgi:hypothetical protein
VTRVRDARPDPSRYLPPKGLTASARAAEQDRAAGGRDARVLERSDGSHVIGSVALRCYRNSRRVYAYLRWSAPPSGTAERYIGDVSDCPDRGSALRAAWAQINSNRTSPARAGAGGN